MSSIDAEVLKFQCGLPIMYKDICLIYSPLLKDIAAEGLDNFYTYISVFSLKFDWAGFDHNM